MMFYKKPLKSETVGIKVYLETWWGTPIEIDLLQNSKEEEL